MNHTKGTWEVVDIGGAPIGVGVDVGGCHQMICNPIFDKSKDEDEMLKQATADMTLIAAAPELLTACTEANKALARLSTNGKLETDDWCRVQSILSNAIRKVSEERST